VHLSRALLPETLVIQERRKRRKRRKRKKRTKRRKRVKMMSEQGRRM